jgi:hypothetical protein
VGSSSWPFDSWDCSCLWSKAAHAIFLPNSLVSNKWSCRVPSFNGAKVLRSPKCK